MKDLNLNLIIRYGYGGLLFVGILLVVNPAFVKAAAENAGVVLTPFLVLGVGASIYVVYRHLLGEWCLYPLAHFIDYRTAKENRAATGALSPIWFLAQLKIPPLQRRDAYNSLRREYLPEALRKQLDLAHAEVHILYITFVELVGLVWYLGVSSTSWSTIFTVAFISVLVLCSALATDIKQHRYELRSILSAKSMEEIKTFLKARGYEMNQAEA